MGYDILRGTIINIDNFRLFKSGDQAGLTYFYNNMRGPVYYYGMQILHDDFLISTFIQEAFLKAWYLRERLSDTLHLFRFVRLCIRWSCSAHFASKSSRFTSRLIYLDYAENTIRYSSDIETENDHMNEIRKQSEHVRLIINAIKYLPPDKQTIMRLYFDYGLSEKQIAQKFNAPHQTIYNAIQKSTDTLKQFLTKTQKKAALRADTPTESHEKYLSGPQAEVYRMRVYLKYSFEKIAMELNTTLEKIINTYIDASETLKQRKPNANKRGNSYAKNPIAYK
ncbi:sigma-70 family RNA polymerase sigma factor [Chitinophaga sp. SYP-B3965]|uniref:RNA polymerase sigma factor n=1 Tax=Chitinophaga sp. SYP-B3965 TaxID=2663120 RepID=UPI0012997FEE|nr:sigma-70 family RNA polymerase sigma factor [Chitinophaga sp. SYP-B3965]MRG45486.1 sigma-70 family RNA polymerase sigma factor [Chitinophaga sp. SYP-B3965]